MHKYGKLYHHSCWVRFFCMTTSPAKLICRTLYSPTTSLLTFIMPPSRCWAFTSRQERVVEILLGALRMPRKCWIHGDGSMPMQIPDVHENCMKITSGVIIHEWYKHTGRYTWKVDCHCWRRTRKIEINPTEKRDGYNGLGWTTSTDFTGRYPFSTWRCFQPCRFRRRYMKVVTKTALTEGVRLSQV